VYQYCVVAVVLGSNPVRSNFFHLYAGYTQSQSHILFHFWGIMPDSVKFAIFRNINWFSSMSVGRRVRNVGFLYTSTVSLTLAYCQYQ